MNGKFGTALLVAASLFGSFRSIPSSKIHEWRWNAGDSSGTHYSPLADINRENVGKLERAWEWRTGEVPFPDKHISPGMFENTPLMIDGTLYLTRLLTIAS